MTGVVSVGGEGNHRRRLAGRWRRVLIAGLGIALVLGACAGIYGKKIVFTQDELQAKVATEFPLKKRKSLVTVNFLNPRILLAPGSDRIGISLDMEVSEDGLYTFTVYLDGSQIGWAVLPMSFTVDFVD